MTAGEELQDFIIAKLRLSTDLFGKVSDRIYDNVPDKVEYPFISLGPSDYVPGDVACVDLRYETYQIDIWSQRHGALYEARSIVDYVKNALHNLTGSMGASALIQSDVVLVRIIRERDTKTIHGVVQVTFAVEEN